MNAPVKLSDLPRTIGIFLFHVTKIGLGADDYKGFAPKLPCLARDRLCAYQYKLRSASRDARSRERTSDEPSFETDFSPRVNKSKSEPLRPRFNFWAFLPPNLSCKTTY